MLRKERPPSSAVASFFVVWRIPLAVVKGMRESHATFPFPQRRQSELSGVFKDGFALSHLISANSLHRLGRILPGSREFHFSCSV